MTSPMIDCIERVFRILLAMILALISYGLCIRDEQTNSIIFAIFVLLLIFRINQSNVDIVEYECESCCKRDISIEECDHCSNQDTCAIFKEKDNG